MKRITNKFLFRLVSYLHKVRLIRTLAFLSLIPTRGNPSQKWVVCKHFKFQSFSRPLFFIIVYIGLNLPVQGDVTFSETIDVALYQILNLRTKTAQEIIDTSRKQNPKDIYLEEHKDILESEIA